MGGWWYTHETESLAHESEPIGLWAEVESVAELAHVTQRRLDELVDEGGVDPSDIRGGHRAHTGVEKVGFLDPTE